MDDTPSRFSERLISADVGTWDYDPNRDRLHADPAFARLLGLDAAAADGGPLANVLAGIHVADRERMAAAFDTVLRTGRPFAAQFRTVDREGRERSVVGRARIERGSDGRIARMPGILIDISDSAGLERRLRESEARAELALGAAGLGTWSVSPDRRLTADRRFAELMSGEPHPLTFDEVAALIHPEDRGAVLESIARAVRPGASAPYERVFRVVHPSSGRERWLQATGRTRPAATGDALPGATGRTRPAATGDASPGALRASSLDGVLADVTDRRLMDRQLRRLAADLADADRRKDEFLAMLAHELRNPLAPISNALSVLGTAIDERSTAPSTSSGVDAPPIDALAREALGTLDRQVDHVSRLVNDLLDISRISRGTVKLERRTVTLQGILNSAIESVRPQLAADGHRLVTAIPDEAIPLSADALRLSQVFINLLSNAIKYSPPASTISLGVARGDRRVRVTIEDRGIGLEPIEHDRIFDMFVQVDASTTRARDGLGIGLALVRRFVDLHGGQVDVYSDGPGHGCEFRVDLPLVGVPVDEAASDAEPVRRRAPKTAPPVPARAISADGATEPARPAGSDAARRILVVDDNVDGADSWVAVFRLRGMQAEAVHDGVAALRTFSDFRPHVVLLDIGMPGLDGLETCRRLRRMPGGAGAHVIAVTGWGSRADRTRTRAAGFDGHLVKPVKASQMLTLLAALPPVREAETA